MEFSEHQIENANLIIDHFGYWPSFHDAEVISICYKRNFKENKPSIEFKVYAFEMTDKMKGRYFELIKHCIIDFELIDVNENSMDGFNHQNALLSIDFGQEAEWLTCELHSAYGVDATFTSKRIRIKELIPVKDDIKY
ncbi:MAG: Imm50 family immunity protein [Chitinophagaceae bacterium]